jgi:hypothetical protein
MRADEGGQDGSLGRGGEQGQEAGGGQGEDVRPHPTGLYPKQRLGPRNPAF